MFCHGPKKSSCTDLQQLGLVVLSAVLVDALAQEGVEPLQLLHTVALTLRHHRIQQSLKGSPNPKRVRNQLRFAYKHLLEDTVALSRC